MEETAHTTKVVGHRPKRSVVKPLTALIIFIVLCGLSFYGGVAYQKDHAQTTPNATTASVGGYGGGVGQSGGRFSGQRPIRGQVAAISPTSITVSNSTTGTSSTFSITSSTTISDNGQTVSTSDIQTGDTVFIIASTSSSTEASRILVNPSYGGGQSSPGSTSAPSATTE